MSWRKHTPLIIFELLLVHLIAFLEDQTHHPTYFLFFYNCSYGIAKEGHARSKVEKLSPGALMTVSVQKYNFMNGYHIYSS